jgi:hypothetical protein
MRTQIFRSRRAWWSLIGVAVCLAVVLGGCEKTPQAEAESSAASAQGDSSQEAAETGGSTYFADRVVEAWEQKGAEAGWIVLNDDGQFTFRDDPPNPVFADLKAFGEVPRYLPGFKITNWQDGMTEALPVPKIGFGLELYSSGISDSGVAEMARLDTLQSLNFYQGRITDEGVKQLTELDDLRAVSLYNTDLTDAAVKDLATIETLEFVDLGGANVRASSGSVYGLQQALPDCTVLRRR